MRIRRHPTERAAAGPLTRPGSRPAASARSLGSSWRATLVVGLLALALRGLVVAWAWTRVPPVADGAYYHRLATRLAEGQGYSWLWPDGAVTSAAHYPVGYPALLAPLYAWLGPEPGWAMVVNALLGALGAMAVHRMLIASVRSPLVATLGGTLVAVHPALVGYSPALMTEGVTASLLAVALWATAAARRSRAPAGRAAALLGLGATLGAATLVRPQSLLLAPLLALASVPTRALAVGASPRWRPGARRLARRSVTAVAIVLATSLAVCAPWTARNCVRMGRCALVSVNAGWNLLIGTDPAAGGGWAPVKVPDPCRTVFDEAGKDLCFERAAWQAIGARPLEWVAAIPAKLAATFDYCGAPGWYLHEAAPSHFGPAAKQWLGVVETFFERLVLIGALLAALRRAPGRRWPRVSGRGLRGWLTVSLVIAGLVAALTRPAWLGYLALLGALAIGRPSLWRSSVARTGPWAIVLVTAAAHALFFGGGRYALVVFPGLCGLAAIGAVRWLGAPRRGARDEPPGALRAFPLP